MKIPNNPDWYVKAILSGLLVIGAIYLQRTTGSIPDWLSIAIPTVIAYWLGSTTRFNSSDGG